MNRYVQGLATAFLLCFMVGVIATKFDWPAWTVAVLCILLGASVELYFRK